MPSLSDVPEDFFSDETDGKMRKTPLLDSETEKRELRKTQLKKDRSENAASFGNNVVSKPGINPSSASFSNKENHRGFHGHEKIVSYKKGIVNTKKKGRNNKDKEMMSSLKNIAKEIAKVEHNKELSSPFKNKKKKKKMKHTKSKHAVNKDISTLNSLGRRNTSLLNKGLRYCL